MEKKILFFGTYLSDYTGSLGPSETIAASIGSVYNVKLTSTKSNAIMRFIDSVLVALFSKGFMAIMDVYSTRVLMQTFIIAIILEKRNIKFVSVLHGGAIPETWESKAFYYRKILGASERILTPSMRICDFISQKGFVVDYQPNPIDLNKFCEPLNSNTVKVNLLWVRAFSEIYNPNVAIETLSILKGDFPELKLTMVGPDKGILPQAKELAKELGLIDSVDFIGPIPNEDLPFFYQSHAVFLNTTSFESFGMAVVEAAASALPVVSTRVGELPYLWEHNVNIKFASDITAASFAKEVKDLLKNPGKALQIGHAGANRVQEFEWNKINEKWINLINNFS